MLHLLPYTGLTAADTNTADPVSCSRPAGESCMCKPGHAAQTHLPLLFLQASVKQSKPCNSSSLSSPCMLVLLTCHDQGCKTCRDGIDVRSTLDNLANAALLAAEVEQEELEAAAVAPPPSRAGKTSVRTVVRRPNKKPRSGSATSSPSSGGPAPTEGQPHPVLLTATASQTKLTELESSQAQDKPSATATTAAAAVPLGAQSEQTLSTSQLESADAVTHVSAPQQSLPEGSLLQAQHGIPSEAATAGNVFDPIAAAIRNATEAITTDGAMQAALPDIDMGLEDISIPEQASSEDMAPAASHAADEGVSGYLNQAAPQQQLPEQLSLQLEQASNEAPPEHLTVQNQDGTVTYPVASDGTVTITTLHPSAAAPGATMMVQQPEGLLIVRDPSTGKERCLGKLLGNSRQTSLILQAANFLEPMST